MEGEGGEGVIGVQTLLNISKGFTGIFFFQNDHQLSSCSLTMKQDVPKSGQNCFLNTLHARDWVLNEGTSQVLQDNKGLRKGTPIWQTSRHVKT